MALFAREALDTDVPPEGADAARLDLHATLAVDASRRVQRAPVDADLGVVHSPPIACTGGSCTDVEEGKRPWRSPTSTCSPMRYFTRGWTNGELDDVEGQVVAMAYRRRLDEITSRLSEPARVLAREVSLHDAIIERVRWCPATKKLSLDLVAGECQTGYRAVELRYLGALLGEQRVETLRTVARDRETEILWDEIDFDGDEGLLIHRILFSPRGELTIDFRELRLEVTPRGDRRVTLGGAYVEIENVTDD